MTPEPTPTKVCGALILGPRVGAHVVLWRKTCKRRTRDESGRCPDHQGRGPFGPGAIR